MLRRLALGAAMALCLTRPAPAQPDLPEVIGLWKPVVGQGVVYEVKDGDDVVQLQTGVVGAEGDGFWLEEVVTGKKGLLVVKVLLNKDGPQRLIVKPGEKGPTLELPTHGPRPPGKPGPPEAGEKKDVTKDKDVKLLGEETVTTPAGTFKTQHFKKDDTDVWVTADIPPLGVVKSKKDDVEVTLIKTLTDVQTRITDTPHKLRPGG